MVSRSRTPILSHSNHTFLLSTFICRVSDILRIQHAIYAFTRPRSSRKSSSGTKRRYSTFDPRLGVSPSLERDHAASTLLCYTTTNPPSRSFESHHCIALAAQCLRRPLIHHTQPTLWYTVPCAYRHAHREGVVTGIEGGSGKKRPDRREEEVIEKPTLCMTV